MNKVSPETGINSPSLKFFLWRDFYIGVHEGLLILLAVTAGMMALGGSSQSLLVVCTLIWIIVSVFHGIGAYFTEMNTGNHFQETLQQSQKARTDELNHAEKFLSNLNLDAEIRKIAADELQQEEELWWNFTSRYDLGEKKRSRKDALLNAVFLAFSCLVGGIIPIVLYYTTQHAKHQLSTYGIVGLTLLGIIGWIKSRYSGIHPILGALRSVVLGAIAAGLAYGIGTIFKV